jgi:hypothetical protein
MSAERWLLLKTNGFLRPDVLTRFLRLATGGMRLILSGQSGNRKQSGDNEERGPNAGSQNFGHNSSIKCRNGRYHLCVPLQTWPFDVPYREAA